MGYCQVWIVWDWFFTYLGAKVQDTRGRTFNNKSAFLLQLMIKHQHWNLKNVYKDKNINAESKTSNILIKNTKFNLGPWHMSFLTWTTFILNYYWSINKETILYVRLEDRHNWPLFDFRGNLKVCGSNDHSPVLFKILSTLQKGRGTKKNRGASRDKDYRGTWEPKLKHTMPTDFTNGLMQPETSFHKCRETSSCRLSHTGLSVFFRQRHTHGFLWQVMGWVLICRVWTRTAYDLWAVSLTRLCHAEPWPLSAGTESHRLSALSD